MKNAFQILILILGIFAFSTHRLQAQMVNHGLIAGVGLGGPQSDGLKSTSLLNPEFGWFIKYNYLENFAFTSMITGNFHKFILKNGRQVNIDYSGGKHTISDAPDYSFGAIGFKQNVMASYSLLDDGISLSAGVFWGINFLNRVIYDEPRAFYNATDEEILAYADDPQLYKTETLSDSNVIGLLASDQIHKGLRGVNKGLCAGITANYDKMQFMLRYEFGLNNYYKSYNKDLRVGQNYLRASVIYWLN